MSAWLEGVIMNRKFNLAALVALAAALIGSAHAAKAMENDAIAIAGAKINLMQAVSAAEQHIGGKAARAEYERHKGQWVFDVAVVKDKKVIDVKVDPASGKVLAATEDQDEHGGEHDSDERGNDHHKDD
jgi:uncharacterized membrane protein YkoI